MLRERPLMTSDDFRRFLIYLPTLFNPKTSDFLGHFDPPYLPKNRTSLMDVPKNNLIPNKQQLIFDFIKVATLQKMVYAGASECKKILIGKRLRCGHNLASTTPLAQNRENLSINKMVGTSLQVPERSGGLAWRFEFRPGYGQIKLISDKFLVQYLRQFFGQEHLLRFSYF